MEYKQCRPEPAIKAELMQVIHTTAARGYGTRDDPHRHVEQYWTLDGTLLAERDSYAESVLKADEIQAD